MNHTFSPSSADTKICTTCKRPKNHHEAYYACESCGALAPIRDNSNNLIMDRNDLTIISDKILACRDCEAKENEAIASRQIEAQSQPQTYTAVSPQAIEQMNNFRAMSLESINMKYARELDTSIERITDLFNAKTVAIVDLKAIIDVDDSIPKDKKAEALFITLGERINKLKPLMRDARTVLNNLGNEEQSIQSYMNNMANRIRKEVREQYSIKDSGYVTKAPPASVKKVKIGINKEDLKFQAKRVAAEGIGYDEATAMALIEMICKQRKISPDKAANQLCKNTKEIESESSDG